MGHWAKGGEAVPRLSKDQGITTPGRDTEVMKDVGSQGQDIGKVIAWTQMRKNLLTYPTYLS